MIWAMPYSVGVYMTAVVVLVVLLVLARRAAISNKLRSLWFFIPRALVLAVVFALLLNPVHESANELPPSRPQVACLIDTSRSMGLDEESRLEMAKDFVFQTQSELARADAAELQLFRFGERFSTVPSLSDLEPTEHKSDVATALQQLQGFLTNTNAPVVVVSDGQFQETESIWEVANEFKALGIPLHVFPVGVEGLRGDIAVERLSVPRQVTANDQVPVRVAIRSQGYQGQRIQLRVVSSVDPDSEPIVTLPITLQGGTQSHDVVVPANPKGGELVLQIPVQADEAISDNNAVPFELLTRNRKIKVFYMEGTEGTEYRFLRDALHDDPSMQCISAVVDNQYTERPRLARVGDPYKGFPASRKELFEYDVVICSDISKGAFTREQLEWTAELVRDRGGGFVMIGGYTSFGAGGWDQTVWDQLIPIDMRGGNVGRGVVNQQFAVNVPAKVRSHPIWRISEDPRKNNQILESIPSFYGTNIAKRLKPAATLLATSAQNVSVAGKTPVFACQAYGKGRTFAMLPDSTVSWGRDFERYWGEGDNRHFRKFWRNVVDWLTENSISGQRKLVISTDKFVYRPGEPIQIDALAFDDEMSPTTKYRVDVALHDGHASNTSSTLQPAAQMLKPSRGRYLGQLAARLPQAMGDSISSLSKMRIVVTARDNNEQIARREIKIQVLSDSDELLTPNANHAALERLAEATGGRVLQSEADLVRALSKLESEPGERVVYQTPAWDKPWLWLGLLGLVAGEWVMRRRSL